VFDSENENKKDKNEHYFLFMEVEKQEKHLNETQEMINKLKDEYMSLENSNGDVEAKSEVFDPEND
jgi:hypothetical protein